MATESFTFQVPGGNPCTIYGEAANINYFLANELDPDQVSGPTNESVSVGAATRRQYPGDTSTVNVSGSTREFLKDPSRRSGSALPGKSFVLAERTANGIGEKRQFTFKGRILDLHSFLRAEAGKNMFFFSNTGARYTIDQAAP
jgi:hypothetical protein